VLYYSVHQWYWYVYSFFSDKQNNDRILGEKKLLSLGTKCVPKLNRNRGPKTEVRTVPWVTCTFAPLLLTLHCRLNPVKTTEEIKSSQPHAAYFIHMWVRSLTQVCWRTMSNNSLSAKCFVIVFSLFFFFFLNNTISPHTVIPTEMY